MNLFGSYFLAVITLSILHCNVEPVKDFQSNDMLENESNDDTKEITSRTNSGKRAFVDETETPGSGCKVQSSDEVVLKTSSGSCIVKKGERFRFLCKAKSPADYYYCNIKTPPTNKIMNLNEEITTKNDSYRYYGESVKSGYCGIEIDNIGDYHNGKFTCVIVIRTREDPIEASIDIIIASAPKEDPKILVSPNPESRDNDADYYRENTTIVATCDVKDSRPAAKISWFINGENVTDSAGKLENIPSERGLVTVRQILTRRLTWKDSKMTVECRAEHLALKSPLTQHKDIYVYFSPRLNGDLLFDEKIIKVEVRANPEPDFSWIVGNETISVGNWDSKRQFMVESTTPVGNYTWLTKLRLPVNASELDNTIKFVLQARNRVGNNSFEIMKGRKTSGGNDTKEVDGLAITFYIVGAIMAIAIIIIVYALITRRWCFSGAKSTHKDMEKINDEEKLESVNHSENMYSYLVEKDSAVIYENNLMEEKELVEKPPMTNGNIVPPVRQEPEGKEIVYAELEIQKVEKPVPHVVVKHGTEGTEYAVIVHKDNTIAK